ncbi:MAG: insulinase family protein [Alphaproteobacteria bacterium]|nr:insulinase family protein [Alphaproteobacteria bacterium]
MKKIGAILQICFWAFVCEAEAKAFAMEEFFLENGMQVIVIENHKAPIVKHMVFYKVGAVDEPKGKGGIAHLLEHLMFRGTRKVKGQEFNKIMEQNGAESNAFTSQDVTAYHQFLDISRLELAMFLEADRMKNLDISDEDFETERDIVFQERKQRIDSNPAAKFYEMVKKALWGNHPYGNPVTGEDIEIKNLNKKDAVDFYEKYYSPNNAVLVLSGDITPEEAKILAKKYYGKLKPVKFEKTILEKLPENFEAEIKVKMDEVKLNRLVKIMAVPSFVQDKKKAYALEVLVNYLSQDENSPLYQRLVTQGHKALDVAVGYDGISRSYGSFSLSVIPQGLPDEDFKKHIDKAWNYALKKLNIAEIEKTKKKMLSELVYMKDNPSTLAQTAGWMASCGVAINELQEYEDNIKNVTLDDVKNVADFVWNKAPKVTGILVAKESK